MLKRSGKFKEITQKFPVSLDVYKWSWLDHLRSLNELGWVLACFGWLSSGCLDPNVSCRSTLPFLKSLDRLELKYCQIPIFLQPLQIWKSWNIHHGAGEGDLVYNTALRSERRAFWRWKRVQCLGIIFLTEILQPLCMYSLQTQIEPDSREFVTHKTTVIMTAPIGCRRVQFPTTVGLCKFCSQTNQVPIHLREMTLLLINDQVDLVCIFSNHIRKLLSRYSC